MVDCLGSSFFFRVEGFRSSVFLWLNFDSDFGLYKTEPPFQSFSWCLILLPISLIIDNQLVSIVDNPFVSPFGKVPRETSHRVQGKWRPMV